MSKAVILCLVAIFVLTLACGKQEAEKVAPERSEGDITIKTVASQTVVYWPRKGPFGDISNVFKELAAWAKRNDYQIVGPPVSLYFNDPSSLPPEEWLWEVQFPVQGDEKAPAEEGGIGVKTTEAMEVASVLYRGPYEQVAPTYGRLMQWIQESGYQMAGPAREVYYNDPSITSPESLLTEIQLPVKKP